MTPITNFTVAGIKTALETLGENTGIFDQIIIENDYTIKAKKDNIVILQIEDNTGNNNWTIRPYVGNGIASAYTIQNISFSQAYLCKQAFYIFGSVGTTYRALIFAKGSNGKCVTIHGTENSSIDITTRPNYHIICMGDDTSLYLYTSGYKSPGYFDSSGTVVVDRTQLIKLPIVGQRESEDYVVSVKFVYLRQFDTQGSMIINGQKYYCVQRFALLDE